MAQRRPGASRIVSTLVVLGFLAVTAVAVACLRWLGDYDKHEFGLTLTERILWGVWVLAAAATFLTHVTIFGWSFRNYVRWDKTAGAPPPRRPTTAPWYKSPVASFSFTVTLVSLTGVAVVATAVLWILEGVIGEWVFWLVSMIIWVTWWVLVLTMVVIRIAVFGINKQKVIQGGSEPPGT